MTPPNLSIERLAGFVAGAGAGLPRNPHAPAAGLLVGATAAVVLALAALPLPGGTAAALAAAVLSTMATVALTGGSHERGLARCADRLAGEASPGHAGVLATGLVLAAKLALLATMAGQSPAGLLAALLAGHAVSRFWCLVLPYGAPEAARQHGYGPMGSGSLWTGGLWCVPAVLLLWAAGGIGAAVLAVIGSTVAFALLVRLYRQRLQDAPTEAVAATQQACELAFYLGAAFGLRG